MTDDDLIEHDADDPCDAEALSGEELAQVGEAVKVIDRAFHQLGLCRLQPRVRQDTIWAERLFACVNAISNATDTQELADNYHERHMIDAMCRLTVWSPEQAAHVVDGVRDRIAGRAVIEIGAGVGPVALAMASVARSVIAIEADPAYTWAFVQELYQHKPPNLTWVFGTAESVAGVLRANVAVILTRSGQPAMRAVAAEMAPVVIEYWVEEDERRDAWEDAPARRGGADRAGAEPTAGVV